jgi:hypothetical protein
MLISAYEKTGSEGVIKTLLIGLKRENAKEDNDAN